MPHSTARTLYRPNLIQKHLSVAILCLGVTWATACAPPASAEEEVPRTITVSGQGEVSAQPDMAHLQVGVTSEGDTAKDALKKNTDAMNALFKVVNDLKIADKDVQTSNFSVQPRYKKYDRSLPGDDQIIGYRVNNQINVRIRDLSILGGALDAFVSQGKANRLNGVSFQIAEPEPLLDQARELAIKDAKRKVDLYTKAAGVTLGEVLTIQEHGGGRPPVFAMAARAEMASDVPIATGESTLSTSVTVTYALQ